MPLGYEDLNDHDDLRYDVVTAQEAWLPTTPYCLGPVVRINGVPIGEGKPGPMWRRVLARWSEIVDKDICGQTGEARAETHR